MKYHQRPGKNRGFSLIELIIIVGIIGALIAASALMLDYGVTAQARRCALEINSLLSQCRVESMTRPGQVTLSFQRDDDDALHGIITFTDETGEVITMSDDVVCSGKIAVDGIGQYSFARDTGAFSSGVSGNITVTGGGAVYHVVLVTSTGEHYILEDENET